MNEFNWLPLSDRKNINIPKVFWEEYSGQNYSGYYSNSADYNTNYIVLVYNPIWVSESPYKLEDVIAHEFRHHIQNVLGLYKSLRKPSGFRDDLPYDRAIKLFFETQPHELDALHYSLKVNKHSKCYIAEDWYSRILNRKMQ